RLGGKDVPIPYNPELEKAVVPREDEIKKAIYQVMNR
ncbi:MAG: alpha-ketoacid dehydrogenase subunit beta, partial [Clostridia bacterium]|nr:alpha-ketoacid dehydrogenase subunit beta [Clostridia bacterium]